MRYGERVRVWIDGWQACCCGEPFSVGSDVEWRLNPVSADERSWFAEPLGDDIAASITHCENHHSGAGRVSPDLTRGRVESITAVYWSVGPRPGKDKRHPDNALYPVVGSALLEERDTGTGSEPKPFKDASFPGYIVELTPLD